MRPGIIVAIVVVLALLVGGGVALNRKSNEPTTQPSTPSTTTNPSSTGSSNNTTNNPATNNGSNTNTNNATQPAASATITYSDSGFSPSTLTVKSGTTVTIKNTAADALQLNSDPHPTHTDNAELNVGAVAAGQSKTFTVTKTGTWGYHNHLEPTEKGSIVVQ